MRLEDDDLLCASHHPRQEPCPFFILTTCKRVIICSDLYTRSHTNARKKLARLTNLSGRTSETWSYSNQSPGSSCSETRSACCEEWRVAFFHCLKGFLSEEVKLKNLNPMDGNHKGEILARNEETLTVKTVGKWDVLFIHAFNKYSCEH